MNYKCSLCIKGTGKIPRNFYAKEINLPFVPQAGLFISLPEFDEYRLITHSGWCTEKERFLVHLHKTKTVNRKSLLKAGWRVEHFKH